METSNYTRPATTGEATGALVQSDATPVQAEPIGPPVKQPVIELDRQPSWLAWLIAFVVFIFNRKLGILFFVILLIFKQYPRLSRRSKKPQQKKRS